MRARASTSTSWRAAGISSAGDARYARSRAGGRVLRYARTTPACASVSA
ncbi:MAG: hypothetical protein U0325_21020 [Polyangiales bacterium]